ncbi:hypothetical protein [Nocardioides marmoribigeumensis]|uniref:DUF4439 domain-containing protein n=1 Tax=Nocardioides marmoribigeumensis TaxID=433649 RepID=A0ABU2BRY9_9ACTN|nr:hypothetical protein [Nocardioides marmoribigeumensis]MDR7361405.1 hypothetical protein [Nocardioides marmoribigeumensis]
MTAPVARRAAAVSRRVLVSRRAVLGTGAAVGLAAALAACDDVPLEQTRPGAFAPPAATALPTPGPDPDRALLEAALLLEATQVARLDRALRMRLPRDVSRRLAAARAVHSAHVEVLRGDDPAPRATAPDPPQRRLLGRLPAIEASIAEQHASGALGAESGPFARILASMAAAARQQATLLAGDQP